MEIIQKQKVYYDFLKLVPENVVQELYTFWLVDISQPLLEWLSLYIVQGQERFWFQHLVFEVLDTLTGRGLAVHHDGLHVSTQLLCDCHVVLFVNGLGHVDETVEHTRIQPFEVLHNLLFLLPPGKF